MSVPLCPLCNGRREGLGWRDQQWLILVCHTKSLFLPPGWAPVRKTNSINVMAGKKQASWHLALQLFRHSNSSVWFIRHCCGRGRHQSSSSYRQVWGPWLRSARTSLEQTAEVRLCLQVLTQLCHPAELVLLFPFYKNRGHRYFGCQWQRGQVAQPWFGGGSGS